MFPPTRWFGVTINDTERDLDAESAIIEAIVERVLALQANAATKQHRPRARGTHAKGVCARADFEVLDVTSGRDRAMAQRLAKGVFAKPDRYPAVVRFANSDPNVNSDFKADVRALSFSVELRTDPGGKSLRQDYSLQSAATLPLNDAPAFLAVMKVLTALNPPRALWSLRFRDKLRFARSILLAQLQMHQRLQPYQRLRYWSTVPFRHGPRDVVKYSATPNAQNPAGPLQRSQANALQDELIRHLSEDTRMSSFDFGLQFLEAERMTYWGKRRDPSFWIENASVRWNEAQSPFHTVARLTLLPKSLFSPEAAEAAYIDVTGNSTPDGAPLGSINRARGAGEVASRRARTGCTQTGAFPAGG